MPRQVGDQSRTEFYEWLWSRFSDAGLLGVHEGTLLSEEAVLEGLETESWTVDSGEAPRERDWVGHLGQGTAGLYFATDEEAESAVAVLTEIPLITVGPIEKQEPQDWDALWKASFVGVTVPPFWKVLPPWEIPLNPSSGNHQVPIQNLLINPGAGFGTGTHETTQLCLQAIGEISIQNSLQGVLALDFGSGSGILSIGMALLGAKVDAVEIDSLANDNARDNFELNRSSIAQGSLRLSESLEGLDGGSFRYSVIVANILRPVLLEFSELLVNRLSSGGVLILSGLIESDLESVIKKYSELLKAPPTRIYEKGEWRAILWGE